MPDSTPARNPSLSTPQFSHPARLSLGNASPAVSTRDHLAFQLDHALARDAVHTPLAVSQLLAGLQERGLQGIALQSNALDRKTYLRRPDLGRTLHTDAIATLKQTAGPGTPYLASEMWVESPQSPRIAIILADGLSALAIERHALPLLDATLPLIPNPYPLIPVLTNARVAIGDQVGHHLGANLSVLLIGERPGLSSPDSLGVYITWNPQPGQTTDAERNCISNIRGTEGLGYAEAAHRIAHYVTEAQRLQTTGIALKDPVTRPQLPGKL